MKNLHNFESFVNESVDMRTRSEIISHLKKDGILIDRDYTFGGSLFAAKDMDMAKKMADSIAGKFRCAIYDEKIGKDGSVPMMIVK